MRVTTAFKHLDHTESLDKRIKEKTKHLNKYLDRNSNIKWTCSAKDGVHYAVAHINGNHLNVVASANSDNLYKVFDIVIRKLTKQLEKKFGNWKTHHPFHHIKYEGVAAALSSAY